MKTELLHLTKLNPELFTEAIDILKRHDVVIEEAQERLKIAVELFRIWLLKRQESNRKKD